MRHNKELSIRSRIRCCINCVPPKRHLGCHADCEEYLAEKEKIAMDKKAVHEQRSLDIAIHDIKTMGMRGRWKK